MSEENSTKPDRGAGLPAPFSIMKIIIGIAVIGAAIIVAISMLPGLFPSK